MNNAIVLNLIEAQVTLYAAQADGTPGGAIWSGQVAERLSVRERWLTLQTRPTGAAYWNGPDGYLPMYTFDPVGQVYSLIPGVSNVGRATISTDGSSITFDSPNLGLASSGPVLATTSDGVTVGELHDAYPTSLPQLLFFHGTTLLAVMDASGFWSRVLADGALPSVPLAFVFQYQGQPVMQIQSNASAATALTWVTTN